MQQNEEKRARDLLPWLAKDLRPEAEAEDLLIDQEKAELAIIRADYQFLVLCQEMSIEELQDMLVQQLSPWLEDEHYAKRCHQALIVLEARTGVESFRGVETISEIVSEKALNRSTLLKAAQRGVFQGRTRQSGTTWLIDTMHESYQLWEQHLLKRETNSTE